MTFNEVSFRYSFKRPLVDLNCLHKFLKTFSDRKILFKHELSTASLQSSTGKVILNIKRFYGYIERFQKLIMYPGRASGICNIESCCRNLGFVQKWSVTWTHRSSISTVYFTFR